MYKLNFTVQKNPTKLFENGLIRFCEVTGLYVPLRFIVEQEEKGKKKKVEVVNPTIDEIKFYLRGPTSIKKSNGCRRDDRAIAEFQGTSYRDNSKGDAYKNFNHAALAAGFEDKSSASCFTHFRVDVVENDSASIFHSPLIQTLELVVSNPETIEHMLKTLPVNGSRYATPMHACLIDVAVTGEHVSHVEEAADLIYDHFKELQRD